MLRGQVEGQSRPPACRIEEGPGSVETLPLAPARAKNAGKWGSGVDLGGLVLGKAQAGVSGVQNGLSETWPYLRRVQHVRRRLLSHQQPLGPVCHLGLQRRKRGKVAGWRETCEGGGPEHAGREARRLEPFWRRALRWSCRGNRRTELASGNYCVCLGRTIIYIQEMLRFTCKCARGHQALGFSHKGVGVKFPVIRPTFRCFRASLMVLLLDFYLNLLNFLELIFYSHTFTVSILQLACR